MRDILPEPLYQRIRDRYLAGVADAEAKFQYGRADEDTLTGALGQAISTPGREIYQINGEIYRYEVSYQKVRGRGFGAPEKPTGADGLFQIEVTDGDGRPLRQKALPFQAKKEWRGADRDLLRQARDMIRTTGPGLVIDYSHAGYRAADAADVVELGAQAGLLRERGKLHDLGHTLADGFLECTIGVQDLFFDAEQERFVTDRLLLTPPEHVITTEIEKIS